MTPFARKLMQRTGFTLAPVALALLPGLTWADTASEIAELKARLAQLEQQVQEAKAAAARPAPVTASAPATGLASAIGD
ncbi:MAG: hypothetical protein VW625_09630, partial [Perlucidibaca sp.]